MSRIGRNPIALPTGVEFNVADRHVTVKGPKGALERTIPDRVTVRSDTGTSTIVVERPDDERQSRSLHGLTLTKELEIIGVGYRAVPKGDRQLELALGFSHPVVVNAPEGITFEVPAPTRITVRGIDKEMVGQVAADIRKLRKPEPYKGKGVRYVDEVVLRKAGKAGK